MQLNLSNWRWSKPASPNPFRISMVDLEEHANTYREGPA
jgi:hypothetical protein